MQENTPQKKEITYQEAGVSTAAGASAVERIRSEVQSTYRKEVIGDIGGFGGLFSAAAFKEMEDPIMVSGTDGVGTKIELAKLCDKHDTVGIDLVAMCVNDIIVTGAEPLFFLDYIAIGKLDEELVGTVVSGVAKGCRQAGCALVGGEMAEHPGTMAPQDYDLSGFSVGVVDRPKMIDGSKVMLGDVLVGIPSSGLHSNGFSLVRAALLSGDSEADKALLASAFDDENSLGEALLSPTRIYVKTVLEILQAHGQAVHAIAHITGGGITENLDRVLPKTLNAQVDDGAIPKLPIIEYVSEKANLSRFEKLKTFNCGVGLALVIAADEVEALLKSLRELGEEPFIFGEIIKGTGEVSYLA